MNTDNVTYSNENVNLTKLIVIGWCVSSSIYDGILDIHVLFRTIALYNQDGKNDDMAAISLTFQERIVPNKLGIVLKFKDSEKVKNSASN